ncbi:MAG TPA: DUF2269 domain-containing protein [Steroidobacteraceae bacterium]|nr:DUF2269 domain-containing protein [Steroidobacteraceae bacterium]
MSAYFVLKLIHVLSAAVLVGTGFGIAFFKWIVDRSRNVSAIRIVSEKVVLADWIFTLPAIVVQAVTGVALAHIVGYPLTRGWLFAAICLFCLAGACWIPVVRIQIRLRDLARACETHGTPIGEKYLRYSRIWFWLGVPAFCSVIVIYWLMVTKP